MRTFAVSLGIAAVLFGQKAFSSPGESPLLRLRRTPSLTQRAEPLSCEGMVEESGDRDRLPPWAMGWLMPSGSFISLYRFNTLKQAQSCAAGKEFVIRRWDRQSSTWKKP
jgi:hypothetical protein